MLTWNVPIVVEMICNKFQELIMQGPLKPFYCDLHYFIIIAFFLFYVIQYFEDAKMIRETSLYYTILSFEHNTLSHVEATATSKCYIFWLSLTF